MFITHLLITVLSIIGQSPAQPAAPALVPVRGPATAASQETAPDAGPVDAVPPSSKCAKDRRLARTLRYAVLPLNGAVGDSSVIDTLKEFLRRNSANTQVNALVLQFNLTGGDHDATIALADQIVEVRKRMPVIGVFGSCVGAGAILPMVCDYLIVLNPSTEGMILEWSPGCDVADNDISTEVGKCFDVIVSRSPDRAYMRAVAKALLDPTVDLFLWRGSDGCAEAAQSAPAGTTAVQLSSGKDALAGMTGAQLVASGLALGCSGTLDGVGVVLGVEKWIAQPQVVEKILAQVQEQHAKEYAQHTLALKTGFTAVNQARALVGGLIEAEANARAADPRKQSYRRTYSRNWSSTTQNTTQGSSWQFTRVTSNAWQTNCQFAITAWEGALQMYEQASAATTQARAIAATLDRSALMKSDPEFNAEVVVLQSEVDALMAQAPALTVKGDNAKQSLLWLRNNRMNPAM